MSTTSTLYHNDDPIRRSNVTIVATAFWRRLDTLGHDACRLEQCGSGWRIEGTAVFRRKEGPACIAYRVECGADWKTVRGDVRGFLGRRPIEYLIVRQGTEWTLNGEVVHGLDHLVDLDLGFTPATNLQQLRRVPIAQGCAAHISVAWLDAETGELTELDQRYTRRGESAFWYEAPSASYEGHLKLAPDGFIRHYPTLWKAEQ